LVPFGAKVWRDSHACRWSLKLGGKVRSKAWALHGYKQCFKLCLEWAWMRVLGGDGFDVLDCPIEGLFKRKTRNPNVDESAISAHADAVIL
jgi:hypothetical protein